MVECIKQIENTLLSEAGSLISVGLSIVRATAGKIQGDLKNPAGFLQVLQEVISDLSKIKNTDYVSYIESLNSTIKELGKTEKDFANMMVVLYLLRYLDKAPATILGVILLVLIDLLGIYYRRTIFYLQGLSRKINGTEIQILINQTSPQRLRAIIMQTCRIISSQLNDSALTEIRDINCNAVDRIVGFNAEFQGFLKNYNEIVNLYHAALAEYLMYKFVRFLIKLITATLKPFKDPRKVFYQQLLSQNCRDTKNLDYRELWSIVQSNCEIARALLSLNLYRVPSFSISRIDIGDPPKFPALSFLSSMTTSAGYKVETKVFVAKNLNQVSKFMKKLDTDYHRIAGRLHVPSELKAINLYKVVKDLTDRYGEHWIYYLIVGDIENLIELLKKEPIAHKIVIAYEILAVANLLMNALKNGCPEIIDYVNDSILETTQERASGMGNLRQVQDKKLDDSSIDSLRQLDQNFMRLLRGLPEV